MEPFTRDILFISLYESCRHRTTSIQDADGLLLAILPELRSKVSEGTITKRQIATVALSVLQRFDNVAATMYAAYHPI